MENPTRDFEEEDDLVFAIGGAVGKQENQGVALAGPHLWSADGPEEDHGGRAVPELKDGRRLGPWDGILAGVLFVVFLAAYVVALSDEPTELSEKALALAYGLAGVTAVGSVLYLRWAGRAPDMLPDLGLVGWLGARRFLRAVAVCTAVAVGMQRVYAEVLAYVPWLSRWLAEKSGTASIERMFHGMAWVMFLFLLAPVSEELIFRGLLFLPLRRRFSLWPAVLVSALVYPLAGALVHPLAGALVYPLAGAPPVFVMGCCAAVAVDRAGSLYAGLLVHMAYNLLPLALSALGT